jgi:hypothetical protein
MDASSLGKWGFLAGLAVAAAGGPIWLAAKLGLPVGRLPGDIRIEGEHSSFYFPIATCLLISLLLSLLVTVIHLLRK